LRIDLTWLRPCLHPREGWVLVGLEQASDSVALQNYTFPPKAILILGKEKEGIPQTLLQRLDDVVEIPQLGMIRSLNVHVSAACMIWQWTQQNLLKAAALPAAHGT
jgi:tRNA guanosine-2'-O-methyltransferase